MNLNNIQLAKARKKRGTFEGQIEEVFAIDHGEDSALDSLTFALEAFLDPVVDFGVIIGDALSMVVTAGAEAYSVEVSKGYGITKNIKPIVVPATPDSWQGNRQVYATDMKYSLNPADNDFLHGSLLAGTDYYLSLGYKEYSKRKGASIDSTNFLPADIEYYHNFFLRIGDNCPYIAGGAADTGAWGSDGSTGTNANDIFLAKLSFNGAGLVTVDTTFVRKYITSAISAASENVWVAHKQQAHINGIIAPFTDRVSASFPINNNTLIPTIKGGSGVDKRTIEFDVYKAGTVVVVNGDEVAEPSLLEIEIPTGTLSNGEEYFICITDAGAFAYYNITTDEFSLANLPISVMVLGRFLWNESSAQCEYAFYDPLTGIGITDSRNFGTTGMKRWEYDAFHKMVVFDAGAKTFDETGTGLEFWFRTLSDAGFTFYIGGSYPHTKIFGYGKTGTPSFTIYPELIAADITCNDDLNIFGDATLFGGQFYVTSSGEIYINTNSILKVKGTLHSEDDDGAITGEWDCSTADFNSPEIIAPTLTAITTLNSSSSIYVANPNAVISVTLNGRINVSISGQIVIQTGGYMRVNAGGNIEFDGVSKSGTEAKALINGASTVLHKHDIVNLDTAATGAQLTTLTNGSNANLLHNHTPIFFTRNECKLWIRSTSGEMLYSCYDGTNQLDLVPLPDYASGAKYRIFQFTFLKKAGLTDVNYNFELASNDMVAENYFSIQIEQEVDGLVSIITKSGTDLSTDDVYVRFPTSGTTPMSLSSVTNNRFVTVTGIISQRKNTTSGKYTVVKNIIITVN